MVEQVDVHPGGELQRSADKVAGRSSRKDQPFLCHSLARTENAGNGTASGLRDRTQRLLYHVGDSARFVSRRGIGGTIGAAALR